MKRIFITLAIALVAWMAASAQKGLNIASLLNGKMGKLDGYTEIVVTGAKAQTVGLDVYHSLSTTRMDRMPAIERAVAADGARATSKEVEYRSGRLYYGYYVFSDGHKANRFIFYLNQSLAREHPQNKVTLIYMEGYVSSSYVKKLIKQ